MKSATRPRAAIRAAELVSVIAIWLAAAAVPAQAAPGLCSIGKASETLSFAAEGPTRAPDCLARDHIRTEMSYGTDPVFHKLDLYIPNGATAPYPTVMWVHGGGWRNGSSSNIKQVERLLCRGFAVASINYRLTPSGAIFPAQIHDVKAAIRHLKSNAIASQFSLDVNRFAVFGSSAGGHLTALAATSGTELEDLASGNADVSSRVNAAVAWYPPTDFAAMDSQLRAQGCIGPNQHPHSNPDSAESSLLGCTVGQPDCADEVAAASPMTYKDEQDTPMLVMHGTRDCNVPIEQGRILHEQSYSAGACATYRAVEGAMHGDTASAPDYWVSTFVQDHVADFLTATLEKPEPRGPISTPSANCSGFRVTGIPSSTNGATWTYQSTDAGVAYRLNGVLLAPAALNHLVDADGDGRFELPAVVVSHGGGGAASGYSRQVGRSVATWDAVAIGVAYTHQGGGDGNSSPGSSSNQNEWAASPANLLRAKKTRSLLSCVNLSYLVSGATRSAEVDMTRVAAHGHSMGAYVTGQLVGELANDFAAASHTAGATKGDVNTNTTRTSTVGLIRAPYQAHHGENDTDTLDDDETFVNILLDNGVPNRLFIYEGYGHNDPAFDTNVLSRVRAWYQIHGVLR